MGPNWTNWRIALLQFENRRRQCFHWSQQIDSHDWVFSALDHLDHLLRDHSQKDQRRWPERKRSASDQNSLKGGWNLCFALHCRIHSLHLQSYAWTQCCATVTCGSLPFGLVTRFRQSHHLYLLQWVLSQTILQSIEDQDWRWWQHVFDESPTKTLRIGKFWNKILFA